MRKYLLGISAFVVLMAAPLFSFAETYPHRLTVGGNEIWRIDTDGSVNSSGTLTMQDALHAGTTVHSVSTVTVGQDLVFSSNTASVVFGDAIGTILSTATTTGFSHGHVFTAYLLEGDNETDAAEGSVLIATTPVADQGFTVRVSTGNKALTWVGVAAHAASTGSAVQFYTDGIVLALTTGTVNTGDLLISTAVTGYLWADNSQTGPDVVGVALAVGPAAGGLTKIRLGR